MAMQSESYDLVDYVNEQVLAEWVDADSGETRTLGSLSTTNKQGAGLSFRVGLDASMEQAFMRFSMDVSVRVSGRPRWRQLLLVVPLHALATKRSALDYELLRTADIGEPAPAVHDAGFSDSGFVLRARFSLRRDSEPGGGGCYVLMPTSKAQALRPSTSTTASHLAGIRSLARARGFTLYAKPSTYAQQGVRLLYECLRADTLKQYRLQWAAMYGGHGAQLVDWAQCTLGGGGASGGEKCKEAEGQQEEGEEEDDDVEPPPPYISNLHGLAPRTPSPPPFACPPSPAIIPPLLLSPTQASSEIAAAAAAAAASPLEQEEDDDVLVEQSVSQYYSSPLDMLSAAAETLSSRAGSDVYTIPATPDCLPEIRSLLEAQAAARQKDTEGSGLRTAASELPEACRKRRAESSPAASPNSSNSSSERRRPEAKRAHTVADAAAAVEANYHVLLASPALHHYHHHHHDAAPTPPAAPYAALWSKLFPHPHPPAAAAIPAPAPPKHHPFSIPQQQPSASPDSATPRSLMTAFLAHALAHNPRIYTHPRLAPLLPRLGATAAAAARRTGSDRATFTALRARAGAEFFWDPAGALAATGEGAASSAADAVRRQQWFVADMEALLAWMLGVDARADVGCWGEMVAVGEAARGAAAAAARGGGGEEAYRWAKARAVAAVCVGCGEGEGMVVG